MEPLQRGAGWIARNEFLLSWLYGVPFILSSNFPLVFAASLAAIPFFWVARKIALGRWSVKTPLDVPLSLFLGLGVMSAAVSVDPGTSWRMYAELVGGIALYYAVVNGLAPRNLVWSAWVLLGLAVLMGAVGFLGLQYSEKFLPSRLFYALVPKLDFTLLNARGFTPNIVAGAIAPVIPICWAWMFDAKPSVRSRILILALSIVLLGIVALTQSRGAIIGLVLAFGLILIWRAPRLIWVGMLGVVALAAFGIWAGRFESLDALLVTDSTNSAVGRWELWQRALYIFQDFPFTGIGLGTFQKVVPVLYPLFLNDPTAPLPHAHNLYLQMGVDYGLGGFVGFLGLVTTALFVAAQNVKRARGSAFHWLAVGLGAGGVVFLAHGILDAVFVSTKVAVVIWVLLGTMMAQAKPERANTE